MTGHIGERVADKCRSRFFLACSKEGQGDAATFFTVARGCRFSVRRGGTQLDNSFGQLSHVGGERWMCDRAILHAPSLSRHVRHKRYQVALRSVGSIWCVHAASPADGAVLSGILLPRRTVTPPLQLRSFLHIDAQRERDVCRTKPTARVHFNTLSLFGLARTPLQICYALVPRRTRRCRRSERLHIDYRE